MSPKCLVDFEKTFEGRDTDPTWRIIPVSKWLVTPMYRPFRPFGRRTTPLRGVTNHGYQPLKLTGMILQVIQPPVATRFPPSTMNLAIHGPKRSCFRSLCFIWPEWMGWIRLVSFTIEKTTRFLPYISCNDLESSNFRFCLQDGQKVQKIEMKVNNHWVWA